MRSVFDGSVFSNVQRLSVVKASNNSLSKLGGNEQQGRAFEQVLRDLARGLRVEDAANVGVESSPVSVKNKEISWNTEDLLTNMAQSQGSENQVSVKQAAIGTTAREEKIDQPHSLVELAKADPFISVNESTPGVKNEAGKNQIGKVEIKDESSASVLNITNAEQVLNKTSIMAASPAEMKKIIMTAGKYHGVDSLLGIAVAERESNFNPSAISNDGYSSKGLFQLLDSTGNELQQNLALDQPYDPFNPRQNAYLGIGYLKQLMEYFSKETMIEGGLRTIPAKSTAEMEKLALAAFNAGIGTVARAQRKAHRAGLNPASFEGIKTYLPEITRRYVPQVVRRRDALATLENSELIG